MCKQCPSNAQHGSKKTRIHFLYYFMHESNILSFDITLFKHFIQYFMIYKFHDLKNQIYY